MKRLALVAVAACSMSPTPAPRPAPPVLDVTIGATPIAEARAAIERRGIACEDASLSAMMRAAHAKHGVTDDAGAEPPAGHDRYMNDPALHQARITCAELPLAALGDGRDGTARVLLVADDADAPVRLLALQRTHADPAAGADDARAMFAALTKLHGAPTDARGELPSGPLPRLSPVRRIWRLSGVVVEAVATDLGPTGVSVSEELRVASQHVAPPR